MNQRERSRVAFVVFHVVLGGTLLVASVLTAWNSRNGDVHVRLLGIVEAIGALLFLLPRTVRAGAWLLVVTIGVAFVVHSVMGEWRGDLLVYAAGVAYVGVHGPAYGRAGAAAD